MAATRIIGAVAVKVRPELGGFRRKTKAGILRQLKDIEANVDVKVDVDVDLEKFRRQLRDLDKDAKDAKVTIGVDIEGLKDALKNLDREIARNSEALISLEAKLSESSKKHVGKQVDDVVDDNSGKKIKLDAAVATAGAAAGLKWLTRDRFVNIFARVNKRSVAMAEGVLQSLSGWGVVSDAGRAFESLITQFDRFTVKAGAWGTVLGGITDTLSYMATSALGVADGILEVIGLTAMAPSVLSALAGAVAINIAAWKGFGDAVNGDAEALASLPANAQKAALSLRGAWTAIQKPVQKKFWKGMGTELADLADVIIPQFRDGLANSAEHVGEFGAGVARSFKKISLNGDLKKMFKGLDGFFDNLAKGAEPFTNALNTLGLRGSEYLPRFGTWLSDLATQFDNFITKADEAGDINRWIEDGIQSMKDMGRVISGVTDMFQGLTGAARIAGVGGLTEFADTMQRVGSMMNSEPFKSRMGEIFSGANAGASALNEGVKALGRTLGESSRFVSELLEGFGQLGGTVLKNVSKAIGGVEFQKGILDAIEGLNDGARTLEPTFENVGRVIGTLGTIAGDVFRNIAPLLNTLSGLLADVVADIGPGLQGLAGVVTNTLGAALSTVAPIITTISSGAGLLLDAFNGLPGPIQNVAIALGAIASLKMTGVFSSITSGVTRLRDSFKGVNEITTTAQASLGRQTVMMQRHLDSINANKFERAINRVPLAAKRAFSGLSSAVGGPWGLVIGAAIGVIAAVGAESSKQKAHVDALADSLNGLRTTADTIKVIGDTFTSDNWGFSKSSGTTADAAKRLGVSLEDLQDAALGSDDAMSRINSQLDGGLSWAGRVVKDARDTSQGLKTIDVAGQKVAATYEGTTPFAGWLASFAQSDSDRIVNSIQEQRDAMEQARKKAEDLANLKGIDPTWAMEYSDALDQIGDSSTNAKDRLQALITTSRIASGGKVDLGDFKQSFNDTKRQITSGINDLRNQLEADGKKLDVSKYLNKDGTIKTSSEIGSKLRTMMKGFATDGITYTTFLADSFDTPKEKVESFKKGMEGLRESFNQKFDLDLNTERFNEVLRGLGFDPVEIETHLNEGNLKGEVKQATDGAKSEVKVDIRANAEQALSEVDLLGSAMDRFKFTQYLASIGIDSTEFDWQMLEALARLMGFDAETAQPKISADDAGFQYTKEGVLSALGIIDEARGEAEVDATDNASPKIVSASSLVGVFDTLSSDALLTATDKATAVVTAAKAVVKSFIGKTVKVVANFIENAHAAVRAKIDDIKAKTVKVLANFVADAYTSLRGKIDDIRAKTVKVLADFVASGYASLKSAISSIKSKTVTVTSVFKAAGSAIGAMTGWWANGGLADASGSGIAGPGFKAYVPPKIKAFATGGIESHVAQISRSTLSSPVRIWAEPETGGEAYIPLSPSKRQRSLAIWRETGKRLGADFYEDGGITGGAGVGGAGATFNITNHYPVAEKTSTTVNRALQYASIPGLSND